MLVVTENTGESAKAMCSTTGGGAQTFIKYHKRRNRKSTEKKNGRDNIGQNENKACNQ